MNTIASFLAAFLPVFFANASIWTPESFQKNCTEQIKGSMGEFTKDGRTTYNCKTKGHVEQETWFEQGKMLGWIHYHWNTRSQPVSPVSYVEYNSDGLPQEKIFYLRNSKQPHGEPDGYVAFDGKHQLNRGNFAIGNDMFVIVNKDSIFKNLKRENSEGKPYQLNDVIAAIMKVYFRKNKTLVKNYSPYDLISNVAELQNPGMPPSTFTMDEPKSAEQNTEQARPQQR